MLLRHLPDVSPANASFRAWFYTRWGRENCIILGRSRCAEYAPFTQRLSIKVARGGAEQYFLDRRMIAVDDDNFLILNEGRTYSSRLASEQEMESFSIFFRPGMADEVLGTLVTPLDRLLQRRNVRAPHPVEFLEKLNPHDTQVTPVLREIHTAMSEGLDDEAWYEEQLHFLLERMLAHHRQVTAEALRLSEVKPSTRAEIFRRVARATDRIHSCYAGNVDLADLADTACLSKYHFLRLFTAIHGLTPYAFLQCKRATVACRLLTSTSLSVSEVARRVGYTARSTLFRQVLRWTGRSPRELRRPATARTRPKLLDATIGETLG